MLKLLEAIGNFLVSLLIFSVGLFVYLKGQRSKNNRIFFIFCIPVSVWLFFYGLAFLNKEIKVAELLYRCGYVSIIFIPILTFHFALVFLNKNQKILTHCLYLGYALACIFSYFAIFTGFLISGLFEYPWGHYPKASIPGHFLFLLYFNSYYTITILLLFFSFWKNKNLSPIEYAKRKYVFFAWLMGTFAALDFIPNYGLAYKINFFPVGSIFMIPTYSLIGYAVIKYRLMDIRIAVTRVGIFAVVYALVLGTPFILYFSGKSFLFNLMGENWSIIPLITAVLLATFGPFIYLYFQRRAENILLRTQRQYQQALRDLSKSVVRIRNIEQLFDTLTHQIVYSVKVSYAAIYLVDRENKKLILKSEYHNHLASSKSTLPKEISHSESFMAYLENTEKSLIVEEERLKLNHFFDLHADISLVAPCFTKIGLASIIFLGNKPNNQLYTEDDILTFDTLASQAALAIENCQFAQELADKERVARLQDMDVYSYSLAHEIDNPAQVITAGVAYLQKQLLKELQLPQAMEKDIDDSLDLILEAARRISSMVKAIRDYGSTLNEDFKPLKMEDIVESFSYLISYRFKDKGIILTKEISPDLGYIRGQKPELIQVLEILANNSMHAMRQSEVKKAHLKVFQPNPDTIRITFTDAGYGIDSKILHLIFSPFTTTKASTEGTGMGLANAKKIVERHKGKIWAESEGKNKGATFIVELPVVKDISQEELKKEDKGKMIF